jgi:hypothetical protein
MCSQLTAVTTSNNACMSHNCYYAHNYSLTVLVATERTVKIWDAVGGGLKRIFRNVIEADITAACLDDRERKVRYDQQTNYINYSI